MSDLHERALTSEDWSLLAHWAYFTLNGVAGPFTFPHFVSEATRRARAAGADEPLEIAATRTFELLRIVGRRIAQALRTRLR